MPEYRHLRVDDRGVAAKSIDLFDDDTGRCRTGVRAAVRLRNERPQEPRFRHRRHESLWVLAGRVGAPPVFDTVPFANRAHRSTNRF